VVAGGADTLPAAAPIATVATATVSTATVATATMPAATGRTALGDPPALARSATEDLAVTGPVPATPVTTASTTVPATATPAAASPPAAPASTCAPSGTAATASSQDGPAPELVTAAPVPSGPDGQGSRSAGSGSQPGPSQAAPEVPGSVATGSDGPLPSTDTTVPAAPVTELPAGGQPVAAEVRRTETVPSVLNAAPATPSAAAAATPSSQLVQHLGPVLQGPDGTYTLSLQLYPEELGAVQVDVALRTGEISLALHAGDDSAQETLRAALPDLRSALEAAGLTATALSVDGGRQEQHAPQDENRERSTSATARAGNGATDDTPVLQSSDPDAALDLRM